MVFTIAVDQPCTCYYLRSNAIQQEIDIVVLLILELIVSINCHVLFKPLDLLPQIQYLPSILRDPFFFRKSPQKLIPISQSRSTTVSESRIDRFVCSCGSPFDLSLLYTTKERSPSFQRIDQRKRNITFQS